MVRTCFGGFRTQKFHLGAFRQSLVPRWTFTFGQSPLSNSGSKLPSGTKWPRSTITIGESRPCLAMIRAISGKNYTTVHRSQKPTVHRSQKRRSTGAHLHPAHLRISLTHGAPSPAPMVHRCRGMTETVPSVVRGSIDRTKSYGSPSVFPTVNR